MSNTYRGPLASPVVIERLDESVVVLAADPLRGSGGDDRFAPDAPNPTRQTGESDDLVAALGGNDYIDLAGGNDGAQGGGGNDSMNGGEGNDTLLGQAGNDTLDGGAGSDVMLGGAGDDVMLDAEASLTGPAVATSADTYVGGAGNDSITLGDTDKAYGGTGDDQFFSDRYYSSSGLKLVLVDGGAGNDSLMLSGPLAEGSVMLGGAGDDVMILNPDWTQDEPHPECVGTLFDGGDGNDLMRLRGSMAGAGSTLVGGGGDDTLTAAGQVLVQAGDGDDRIVTGLIGLRFAMETNDMDVVTGAGRDTLVPMPSYGDDPVRVLDFQAGLGGDLIDVAPMLQANKAYMYGPTGPYAGTQPFETGHLRLVADGGDTLLQYYAAVIPHPAQWATALRLVGVTPGEVTDDNFLPGAGPGDYNLVQNLTGTDGNDAFTGHSADDSLRGLAGDDLLDGGFDGRDTLVGDAGADQLFGFEGDDVLDGGTDSDLLWGGDGNDTLLGGDGDDGGSYTGSLHGMYVQTYDFDGGAGNDLVDGGAGNDTMQGGDGSDTVLGGDGDDTLFDNSARFVDFADLDPDELDGGAGDDRIVVSVSDHAIGGSGDDHISYYSRGDGVVIDAGDGDDLIDTYWGNALAGTALVTTGSGADIVRPGAGTSEALDTQFVVTDFDISLGADRIDLVNVNRALGLADDADPFATGRARLVEADGATHLELDVDKKHTVWGEVLTLNGIDADSLTSDNFVQDVQPIVGPAPAAGEGEALLAADVLDFSGGMIEFAALAAGTALSGAASASYPEAGAGASAVAVADSSALPLQAAWATGAMPAWQHDSLAMHAAF